MTPIELAILINRVESICAEMGAVLQHAAFSPNIKDRLDFSCALFDAQGELYSQAAHIPVHLGSMAYAMADIVGDRDWLPGDVLAVNDPFLGGTHLPDVTLVSPCFVEDQMVGFVANRAHHADIGSDTPGSMPLSRSIDEEGLVIPPTLIQRRGEPTDAGASIMRGAGATHGDFAAQASANTVGVERLQALVSRLSVAVFFAGIDAINEYGARLARQHLRRIPSGVYRYQDVMDDDGWGALDIDICVRLTVAGGTIDVDFDGTADQVAGNINCPLPVTAAAVLYCFRCLMPAETPNCAGTFRSIRLNARSGSLVNANRPAAVAAGNVETSMRIVDTVLGALSLAIPAAIGAASQGTMNNIAMGSRTGRRWDYYETVAGGMGATSADDGLTAVQSHMTNTLNTPVESLETHYPLRITEYSIRKNSGGEGGRRGGDGLVRAFQFLEDTQLTVLSERRRHGPPGMAGGLPGLAGVNRLDGEIIPGKCHMNVRAGQVLRIETPGGGGFGPVSGPVSGPGFEEQPG
jgi:N-methylhydantoinase B